MHWTPSVGRRPLCGKSFHASNDRVWPGSSPLALQTRCARTRRDTFLDSWGYFYLGQENTPRNTPKCGWLLRHVLNLYGASTRAKTRADSSTTTKITFFRNVMNLPGSA